MSKGDRKGRYPASALKKMSALAVVTMMIACCLTITCPDGTDAVVGPTSGTCGPNLNWSLDTDTGHLTITGTGAMDDFSSYGG